jgi:hypothetical protein
LKRAKLAVPTFTTASTRPCRADKQQGFNGKCNVDDIISIRALAFDVDFTVKKNPDLVKTLLAFIHTRLTGALRPTLVIDSGGGVQLIYLLKTTIDVRSHPISAGPSPTKPKILKPYCAHRFHGPCPSR